MKHLFGMLAAAAVLVFGLASAQASPVPPSGIGTPIHMANGTVVPVWDFSTDPIHPADSFYIKPSDNGNLAVQLNSIFNLNFLSIKLYDGLSEIASSVFPPSWPGNPALNPSLLFSGLLSGHTYQLIVSFLTGDGQPGSYLGYIALTSVPLPASLPLLAAALGILALIMYRKRLGTA